MKRLRRWLAILLVAVLVIAVAGFLFLHTGVVRSRALAYTIRELESRFNLTLAAADLRYNLVTRTASLHDIRLAARGHAQPFFTARQVRVKLPVAVYRGRLAFDRIEVDDGRVDVVRDVNGVSNLPGGGGGAPLAEPRRLSVDGLLVSSLDFALDDQENDVAIAARGITADLRRGGPLGDISGPFGVRGGVTVRWRERTARLSPIESVLGFSGSAVALKDLPLAARELNVRVGGGIERVLDEPRLNLSLAGAVDLEPAVEWVTTPVPVSGRADISGTMTGPPSAFTMALDVNGRGLAIGRDKDVAIAGPLQLTSERLTSGGLRVSPSRGGSIQAVLDVPFGAGAPARITAVVTDLDARSAVALANVDPPAVGAAISGDLEFTPGDELRLAFSTSLTPKREAGVTPLAGTAAGGIGDSLWTLTHNLNIPGLAAAGQATGRFNLETPQRSSLGGGSNVVATDIGSAIQALAPLGVDVPDFVRQLSGTVKAPARFAGSFDDPRVTASIEADQLQVPSLGRLDAGADLDITRRLVTIAPLFASRFSTVANGQVSIDLTTRKLGGTVRVMTANAADLQTAVPLEWQLEGPLTVVAALGGTIGDPLIDVAAEGTKNIWARQAFDALSARVQIDDQQARVETLRLQQGSGRIETSGAYEWETRSYKAIIDGQGLSWRGPLAGGGESLVTLSAHFEGAGTLDRPGGEGRAEFSMSGGTAGDLVGDGSVDVSLDGRDAHVRGVIPSLGALVTGTIGLQSPMPYRLVGVVNRVDLAKLVPLAGLNADEVQGDTSLSLAANGELIADDTNGTHPDHIGPQLFANLQTLNATVGGVPVTLSAPARIDWRDDELTVTAFDAAIGKGTARASGTWAGRTGTRFEGSFNGELGDVLRIARVFDLPAEVTGQGQVNVVVQSSGDPSTASATLILDKGRITWGDGPPLSELQVEAAFRNETLTVSRVAGAVAGEQISGEFEGHATATVKAFDLGGIDGELVLDRAGFDVARIPVNQQRPTRITLRSGVVGAADVAWSVADSPIAVSGTVSIADATAFDLDVKGSTDLRIVTAFVPAIGVDGTADLDVHVGGTPDQPALDGRINLTDAEFALPNPRVIIGDLSGPILLKGNTITIPSMRGSANGGDMDVEGELELIGRELAGEILAQATGVAVEFPRGLRSEADFILTFQPGPGAPRLIGDVRVQRASYTETISLAALARTRRVTPPRLTGAAGPSFADRIALNVSLVTVEDMVVDNNYGRFDTGASVRVVGTVADPGMTGRITMREGGEVYLAGRTFKINRGDISFTELSRIAPEFNIEAEARVGSDDLTMQLTGPVDKPEFALTSSSRDKTGEELAASLIGGNNTGESALTLLSADLLGVTGRALRLDTLRIERGDAFDSDFREDPSLIYSDADPATRLTISKRIRHDVEVTVSQNLRESGQSTFIVSYYILPNFEIRAISKDDNEFGIGVRHQLTFGGPAGVGAAARPPQPTVAAITFSGDPAPLQEAGIRNGLRLAEGDEFNFYDWQRDIDELREAYVEQSRYEARVRARRVASDDAGSIALEYRLEPGPRTEIEIRGLELPAAERRAMEEAWTRAVFDRFLMDDLESRLRRYLVSSGHVEGTVEGRLSEADGVKRALLIVDPGARAGSRAILFSGNTAIGANRLADAVTAAGLDVDAWLDPQQLVPMVRAFYQDHGFLDSTVTVGVPRIENGRGVLPVTVVEGSGVAVSEIVLTGVTEERQEVMRAAIGYPTPAPYESARALEARNRLERAYRTRGFNAVQIATDSKIDAAKTAITLTFAVEEGPQQILREVVTSGATRTREGVVSRALNLPVDGPVNLEEWARARKRLYDTNVFRQVDVTAEPLGEPAAGIQNVRARVTVVEYPPWRFRYGLQLEGDRQAFEEGSVGADELGVVGEVKNQNMLGRAVTGGVFARYERLAQDATVFASNASFFGLPIRSSVFGFLTRDKFHGDPNDPDLVIAITDRIGASFEQRVRPRGLEVTYAYRYETNHTYDPEPSAGDEFPLNVRANLGRLSSAVIYNRRSDLLDARTGTFSAVSVEHAAAWLGSDAHYTKMLAQQQLFFSGVAATVLASRAQFGLTWHPENLLPVDRFKAGGATTVRGYPENSLGPSDFFGLPKGGGQLVILNQEVRFPLYRWFGGVAFIDAGNIFDTEYQFDWSELKIGYGAGLRLSSPVGMLRLDFGIPGSTIQSLPTIQPNSLSAGRWYFGLGHVF